MIRNILEKSGLVKGMLKDKSKASPVDFSPAFSVAAPDQLSQPFVFNSPHSGREYPKSFIESSQLDPIALRKSEDAYVEELFADVTSAGAPILQAHFPRAYLDVNREPYELDPELFTEALPDFANTRSMRVIGGLGTIARIVTETEEIYRHPLTVKEALDRIHSLYMPYHKALGNLIGNAINKFNGSILIDCHSMPSVPPSYPKDMRPDFVLGDRYGSSCTSALTLFIEKHLTDMGFLVCINKPYAGGYITEAYGKPEKNVHAIQVEINRALYMDEITYEKKDSFHNIQKTMAELNERLFSEDFLLPGNFAAAAE